MARWWASSARRALTKRHRLGRCVRGGRGRKARRSRRGSGSRQVPQSARSLGRLVHRVLHDRLADRLPDVRVRSAAGQNGAPVARVEVSPGDSPDRGARRAKKEGRLRARPGAVPWCGQIGDRAGIGPHLGGPLRRLPADVGEPRVQVSAECERRRPLDGNSVTPSNKVSRVRVMWALLVAGTIS